MSHSKRDPKKKQRTSNDLSEFGIFAVPNMTESDDDLAGDDELEAELMSIISSDNPRAKVVKKKNPVTVTNNLDKMVADSMKDVASDASLSGDEDDPSLLAELKLYTGGEEEVPENETVLTPISAGNSTDYVSLITERINMYKEAEANANSIGDTSKARRVGRGLKTLNELLRKAKSGVNINEEDIPLPIAITASKPAPIFKPVGIDFPDPASSEAESISETPDKDDILTMDEPPAVEDEKQKLLALLCARRDEYKKAAIAAKRSGNTQTALANVKVIKQFDAVIAAAEEGQSVDLSTMPPPPGDPNPCTPKINSDEPVVESKPLPEVVVENADVSSSESPLSVLEALEQRLNKFLEQEEAGKKDGNMSKARRMGRIVKQYQDAIKLHKAGKPIPVEELPTPPGFPPIPVETSSAKPSPAPSPVPSRANTSMQPSNMDLAETSPLPSPKLERAPSPLPPSLPARSPQLPPPVPARSPQPSRSSQPAGSKIERQLLLLRTRQKQYREAAVKAKKSGDIPQAKEYLRLSKSFDPLIEASLNGLPVDMSTLPTLPGSKERIEKEFEIIQTSDCIPGNTSEVYSQIISDLQKQLQMCMETRAHFKAIGDVGSANKFEQLAINTKKDLDTVKIACNKDDPVPRFHYEKRNFSIVRCNTDLNDNDFELSIIQGINYNVPNPREIDTYIKFEFPYPTDNPYREKTQTVYNTNNPDYNSIYNIEIQRSNRSCQRIFKRQSIKFEVWSKGYFFCNLCGLCSDDEVDRKSRGFFRSDSQLGTVAVKLQPLETKCTIHDSFPLMDGRKTVGGKLEIKVRIRNPIVTKQIETLEEKWLVVD